MEEVLLKWKPAWNRLKIQAVVQKTLSQKMGRICGMSRDFKPFIAPTALHLLRKI